VIGLFSGFMVNTWIAATLVAVVAGAVGFFVVMRGSAFVAHAVPSGSFAGAAAAVLVGVNELIGLGVFSVLAALGIGVLGRRGRFDVAVALTLVSMVGLGFLLLSFTGDYQESVYSLLFGEILGVSSSQVRATALLAVLTVAAIVALYRPLLLASVLPDGAAARGVNPFRVELCFLIVVALATTMTVPVSGTTLIFTLLIGPAAAARSLTARPERALLLSIVLAEVVMWAAIAAQYQANWPVGFFVGTFSAVVYALGRAWGAWARSHP
jgi:zinc/manganese transport system permease protein